LRDDRHVSLPFLEVVLMFRLCVTVASVLFLAALVVEPGHSGDGKKDPVIKKLPANWKKLGLTDEQKQKIYQIRGSFGPKMDALRAQLEQLKKQETTELIAVLTEEQKTNLRKILAGSVPEGKKKADDDKKKDTDKK
jgi:Spy/CpxP family protein refolding chaperone